MMMTLEQLRIFVAVAVREHVTKAAGELNLTQSAVSAAILALETRYDVRLFDRVGRRIALTDAGRMFLGEARAVLARASLAETMLSELAGLKRGAVNIAASQTVGNYWLPPVLARYRKMFPGIDVRLLVGNTSSVATMVQEGISEIGFVEGTISSAQLMIEPVAQDDLVLVVATELAQEAPKFISASYLKALPWVLREVGSGTREILEAVLLRYGVSLKDLDVRLELPSNEAVRSAVLNGAGASVLSRLVVQTGIASGILRPLEVSLPKREFYIVKHKDRSVTKASKELCRIIESRC